MKQKLRIRYTFSISVLSLIQIQSLDLSEYLLIDYPNLIDYRVLKLQYTKKKTLKMYSLVFSFFTG